MRLSPTLPRAWPAQRPALILAAGLLGWSAVTQPSGSRLLETRRFTVRYPSSARLQAEAIASEADPLAERLERELGVDLGARAEIVLCDSDREFDAAAGAAQPAWVVGVARPGLNRIALRLGSVKGLRRVTRHEVAHLLVGKALGEAEASAPRWLHEGAAKYYAADWTRNDRAALAEAVAGGRLPTIDELEEFPTHPAQGAGAYAASYVLVEYLVSLDASRGLSPFLTEIRRTGDTSRAFVRTYRLSQNEVEAGWHEAMATKTRTEPIAWAVETTIFLLLVIAFIFAYARVRRRSREIRRRMEEEELVAGLVEETLRREASGLGPKPRPSTDDERGAGG